MIFSSKQFFSKIGLIILIFFAVSFSFCKTNSPIVDLPTEEENVVLLPQQPNPAKTLQTIAFGSCNRQDLAQPLWNDILKHQPDLWIWLGDIIYGDSEDAVFMENQYNLQSKVKGYQELIESTPIIGVWDDHDYGLNDGG